MMALLIALIMCEDKCSMGSSMCSNNMLSICDENGHWVTTDCPEDTECNTKNNSMACLPNTKEKGKEFKKDKMDDNAVLRQLLKLTKDKEFVKRLKNELQKDEETTEDNESSIEYENSESELNDEEESEVSNIKSQKKRTKNNKIQKRNKSDEKNQVKPKKPKKEKSNKSKNIVKVVKNNHKNNSKLKDKNVISNQDSHKIKTVTYHKMDHKEKEAVTKTVYKTIIQKEKAEPLNQPKTPEKEIPSSVDVGKNGNTGSTKVDINFYTKPHDEMKNPGANMHNQQSGNSSSEGENGQKQSNGGNNQASSNHENGQPPSKDENGQKSSNGGNGQKSSNGGNGQLPSNGGGSSSSSGGNSQKSANIGGSSSLSGGNSQKSANSGGSSSLSGGNSQKSANSGGSSSSSGGNGQKSANSGGSSSSSGGNSQKSANSGGSSSSSGGNSQKSSSNGSSSTQSSNGSAPSNGENSTPTSGGNNQKPASGQQSNDKNQEKSSGSTNSSADKKDSKDKSSQGKSSGGGRGGVNVSSEQINEAMGTMGYSPKPEYVDAVVKITNEEFSDQNMAAMFLAQLAHESGGFQHMEEIDCAGSTKCADQYGGSEGAPGKSYHGRGFIQLSWPANYKEAGEDLGLGDQLFQNPDMILEDPELGAKVSHWYWKSRVETAPGVSENKFGATTKAINGALECTGSNVDQSKKRYEMYKAIAGAMGITDLASEDGCY